MRPSSTVLIGLLLFVNWDHDILKEKVAVAGGVRLLWLTFEMRFRPLRLILERGARTLMLTME